MGNYIFNTTEEIQAEISTGDEGQTNDLFNIIAAGCNIASNNQADPELIANAIYNLITE